MDLLVKWSSDYPTGEVLFFRGFFGLLPTYFLIPKGKLKTFYTTERSKEHLFRCLMGLMALIAIVVALRELPLAVVVSLSYAAPLFITVLSIFLLSEKVGIFRWLAVLIGFIGVIIIAEPGFKGMNYLYFLPLIFCIGMAFVTITIRKLSTTEPIWLISIFFYNYYFNCWLGHNSNGMENAKFSRLYSFSFNWSNRRFCKFIFNSII
jgi:drug/metabolite transporter (DMT)-like permease